MKSSRVVHFGTFMFLVYLFDSDQEVSNSFPPLPSNMSEKFCLKWNDFQTNVTSSFSKLRNEDEFFDVTLVSDDQQQVSAHKLVLSSCSEYFKNILKFNNKHSHPLLCLEGISSAELNCILDYIYKGEVQIYQEQLDRFLTIAQRLKLEGLLGDASTAEENYDKKTNFEPSGRQSFDQNIKAVPQSESRDHENYNHVKGESKLMMAVNNENETEVEEKINSNIVQNEDGKLACGLCGKTATTRQNIRNHIQTHMDGLSYPCNSCEKTFRSDVARRMHIHRKHK